MTGSIPSSPGLEMSTVASETTGFEPQFRESSDEPFFMRDLRARARLDFERLGLPTNRIEAWRFASLKSIALTPFVDEEAEIESLSEKWIIEGTHRLTFVNGRFSEQLSSPEALPDGVHFSSLRDALEDTPELLEAHLGASSLFENHAFKALNTANFHDGALVHIPAGAESLKPVHLLFVTTADALPRVSYPRTLVIAEESSRLTLVETHVGEGAYMSCPVVEFDVAESARVEHMLVIDEADEAQHLSSMTAELANESSLTSHSLTFGGKMVRSEIVVNIRGENADAKLNGLSVSNESQHVEHQLLINHFAPNTTSDQLYRGILNDTSKIVFTGRIFVAENAQKIEAGQANHNLLLSDSAVANSNPQLEIYADDVRCSHGSTVGRHDEEALFYMRSRGIPRHEAESILVSAFASDLISRISIPALTERLERIMLERIS